MSSCVEKLIPSSCVCPLPCSCSRANVVADLLGVSPMYHQEDTARWNSAACFYQVMNDSRSMSRLQQPSEDRKVRSAYHSPERDSNRRTHLGIGGSMHNLTLYQPRPTSMSQKDEAAECRSILLLFPSIDGAPVLNQYTFSLLRKVC
ncbi:unnamed protein product [Cylicocyclus nassatus]|uniref:Uncharacterized protein n=1 Tax=Cylicocyclus nassatus TaxID=53992 RepID=A0AA36DPQ8_CYLNA|nr:unnamed protein product [Cylicocyclus nassatus]